MSNITFMQYNPNQEKKRNYGNSSGACVNCRKAHAACNTWRPCDRCVRMQCECRTSEKKKKKDNNTTAPPEANGIDVDTVSKLLFDTSKPLTPLHDPFSLPSPLSAYVTEAQSSEMDHTTPTFPPLASNISFVPNMQNSPNQQLPTDIPNSLQINPYPADFSPYNTPPPPLNPNAGAVTNTDKMDELMAQNARMEKLLASLSRKVDYLQTQISTGAASPMAHMIPATASWKLPSCELLECNQKFLDLLGYNDGDQSLSTFFQLGACTEAMGRISQKIEYSIKNNVPIQEPTYSSTLVVPMFKKNREVVHLNISVVISLHSPFPVMTTVLHKLPPGYVPKPGRDDRCTKKWEDGGDGSCSADPNMKEFEMK